MPISNRIQGASPSFPWRADLSPRCRLHEPEAVSAQTSGAQRRLRDRGGFAARVGRLRQGIPIGIEKRSGALRAFGASRSIRSSKVLPQQLFECGHRPRMEPGL